MSMLSSFRTHQGLMKPNGFSWDTTSHSRLVIYFRARNLMLRLRRVWNAEWWRWEAKLFWPRTGDHLLITEHRREAEGGTA